MISADAGRSFQVLPDAGAIATQAAERIILRIAANAARPAICLTGGSGPKALYALLGGPDYRSRIAWDRVHWFIGDERFVSAGDERNNMAMARKHFPQPLRSTRQHPSDADRRIRSGYGGAALRARTASVLRGGPT